MGRWKTARRGRSEKDDGAFGWADGSKEGGVSDWVATAGGLRDLRLNAPSSWLLASQAKITTCKTKTHRSSLRSPVEARSGLLALSVMATPMEQTPCQVRKEPCKSLESQGGRWKNRQGLSMENRPKQVRLRQNARRRCDILSVMRIIQRCTIITCISLRTNA